MRDMVRIRPIDRADTARAAQRTPEAPRETGRAVVAVAVARSAGDREPGRAPPASGRPLAGFLAQLILSGDPTLAPSRAARMGLAAARYEEAARLRG